MNDESLLKNLLHGDHQALREVLNRYESALIGYLICQTKDEAMAQDIAQETFLKLIHKPPGSLKHGSLKPWLFKVAHRKAIDEQRKRKRFTQSSENVEKTGRESPYPMADADAEYLISSLPGDLKQVVVLRIYGDLSFREIASQLKIPIGTALWRMQKSIKIMRDTLSPSKDHE